MSTLKDIGVMQVNEKGEDTIIKSSAESFWRMYDAGNIFGKPLNK